MRHPREAGVLVAGPLAVILAANNLRALRQHLFEARVGGGSYIFRALRIDGVGAFDAKRMRVRRIASQRPRFKPRLDCGVAAKLTDAPVS